MQYLQGAVEGATNFTQKVATGATKAVQGIGSAALKLAEKGYSADSVIEALKTYTVADGAPAPVVDMTNPAPSIAAAFISAGDAAPAIQDMVATKKLMVHNGLTIYYVPTAEELLTRLAAATYYQSRLNGGFEENFKGVSEVPASEISVYLNSPLWNKVTDVNKKAFNARAEEIKNSMANPSGPAGRTDLYPVGEKPKAFAFTGIASGMTRPKTPEVLFTQTKNPFASFRLVEHTHMRGGSSVSSHAPLYPKVVMNGGAHPFATLHGGDGAAAVANIKARIAGLERQFELNSGKTLTSVLGKTSPSAYADSVSDQVTLLENALNQLRNANLALASAPLANGVNVNYEQLVQKGEEISRLAAKTASGWDKLSKIHDMLAELVEKTKTVKLSGGLHNALKH
jgi:hypothetical protein